MSLKHLLDRLLQLLFLSAKPELLSSKQAERGSIIIPMAGVIFVGLVLLGSVHLGYAFYLKRELQNAADTAALTGAQYLTGIPQDCVLAKEKTQRNIELNLSAHSSNDLNIASIFCGTWNPITNEIDESSNQPDSILVTIRRDQPAIMPFMKTTAISAKAIAQAEIGDHIAAFSVGPQLAGLEDGVLTKLLETVGLDVSDNTLVDYRGLANIKITPAGLLQQLGIEVPADITLGNLDALLSTELGVRALVDVVQASINAASDKGLLSIDQLNLLQAITASAKLQDLHLPLFTDELRKGLFVLLSNQKESSNKNKRAGLDAEVSLATILDVALGVANKKHAVALEKIDLNLGILRVESQASVIEPPSIGIGGIGTQAHSANVRVFLRLCLDLGGCKNLNNQGAGGLQQLLGSLLSLKLDLPIVLELVNATGRIENMCYGTDAAGHNHINISVKTETAGICIGKFGLDQASTSPHHPFSETMSCTQKIKPNGRDVHPSFNYDLFDIRVLGLSLLKLNSATTIAALSDSAHHEFAFDPTVDPTNPPTPNPNSVLLPETGNRLKLGDTTKQLTDSVLTLLIGNTLTHHSPLPSGTNNELVNKIWEEKKAEIGCTVDRPWLDQGCRKDVFEAAENQIKNNIGGLRGFLGNLLGPVLGLLGDLLTLDILGVLGNVLGLLDGVLGALLGSGCYIDGILAGVINPGSEAGCKFNLNKMLTSMPSNAPPNALLVLLGQLLNTLEGPLNLIGENILSPLLNALGLKVGQVETTIHYLNCQPKVRLVY